MTLLDDRPEIDPDILVMNRLEDPDETAQELEEGAISAVSLGLAVVSGALSAVGAAWMIGGLFRGSGARLVGVLGVVIGCGLVYLGTRLRSSVVNYLVLPSALVVGALLMGSASGAGTSSLPSLVKDAATTSHVLQPPIDFAPGWRLIIVVVLALLSAAACTLSLSLNRPRLAVAVPAPLTVVAALVQPGASAITTSAVAVAFVMMALATSYAADGVGESFDTAFELRRLGRSALAGVVLVTALILASKVSFLFPDTQPNHVVPPRRPPVSPPQPDVPLYAVKGALDGPLRVGVIDVYSTKDGAWLLPPVDNHRLKRLHLPADVPKAPAPSGTPTQITVTIEQAKGHVLPTIAGTRHVAGDATTDYDPRTDTFALATRPVFTGLHYTLAANPAPNGEQLSRITGAVPDSLREFLAAPPVPPAVEALLQKAPQAPFARLQALRTELYSHFVAAGQGKPTDVDADRVVELLDGGTGNPYELTASEALLARWAGIPSRMGFGYFDGEKKANGVTEFRPANAATYLEVYFAPYGWVPVIGTPPKAQQSLSNNQRNNDANIQASPELGINVYLPVLAPRQLPIYEYARYYLVRVLPVVLLLGALVLLYPVVLKRTRRRRRRVWGLAHGPAAQVAVAYCELRDQMIDLALPGRAMTPLELVELVDDDEEHAELAWLATRGLWGDLRGQLTADDALVAQRLAASVSDRITKAQPETARLLAAVSRASLRHPYSTEVPNVWWKARRRGAWLRPATAATLVLLVGAAMLSSCSSSGGAKADPIVAFPTRLAPASVAGLEVREEPKAADAYLKGARDRNVIVAQGKVLSFNKSDLVQAALQVAQLKRGFVTSDGEVSKAIAHSVGNVHQLRSQRGHVLYNTVDGTQRVYLWFPTVKSMAILVVRAEINKGAAEALARALIDYGDGRAINDVALSAAFADTPVATTDTTETTEATAP
ncbi:MAG TPA: transglutaminaseTgpA domain-containing protein [Acidimicrobiales bacterium]|nr:transglutaminaseTgpA domain-containing protein [Acidimicrobiales bacterium]